MGIDPKAQGKASFTEWNIGDKAVDPVLMQGKYINARSTLVAAGPPLYSDIADSGTSGDMVYPIGLIENLTISQQKNLQRLYELGSDRSYFVPGRTMSSASLGRIMFHGPSLLRVLYAYYPQSKINLTTTADLAADEVKIAYTDAHKTDPCLPFIEESPGTVIAATECDKGESPSFYMNLASNLFDRPLGLMVYLKDIRNKYYSAFYLEMCYVSAHNLSINSSSTVIAEGAGLQFDRIVPVDLSA
jgi:hypothetical protein